MSKRVPHPVGNVESVTTVAIKVSLLQLVKDSGETYTTEEAEQFNKEEIVKLMREQLESAIPMFDSSECIIVAMIHDKGSTASKGLLAPSVDGIHLHIIVKLREKKKMRLTTLYKKLGIRFQQPRDNILLSNGGCETIGTSWKKYFCCLKHDTPQAVHAGKAQYTAEDYITNLSQEELEMILDANSGKIDFPTDKDNKTGKIDVPDKDNKTDEIDAPTDKDKAADRYVSDLGNAYKDFVLAFYNSGGNLAYAENIKRMEEQNARKLYECTIAGARTNQTSTL